MTWQTKPLRALCEVEYGTRVVQKRDGGTVFPVYGGGGETFRMDTFNREDQLIVSRFAMSGECVRFVTGKFYLNDSGLTVSSKDDALSQEFLDWQILSKSGEIFALGRGSAQRNLDVPAFRELSIAYPALPEQHRIVAILDEAFAGIATAKANAEKSLRNARDVFSGYLDAMLDKSKDVKERRLGDLVTRLTNGYVGPIKSVYVEAGVPYLLARHVRDNKLKFDGKTFITEEFNQKNRKSILQIGDVLLVQSGHIGHSAVVTEEHEGHNCHAMIVITPVEGAMTGEFLSLLFNSAKMRKEFDAIRSGSTVPHLTCKEVREMAIKLPDLAMQKEMVTQSKKLQAETQRLESLYTRKLAALDELRQSLLQQAFSGQL